MRREETAGWNGTGGKKGTALWICASLRLLWICFFFWVEQGGLTTGSRLCLWFYLGLSISVSVSTLRSHDGMQSASDTPQSKDTIVIAVISPRVNIPPSDVLCCQSHTVMPTRVVKWSEDDLPLSSHSAYFLPLSSVKTGNSGLGLYRVICGKLPYLRILIGLGGDRSELHCVVFCCGLW